ncbi:hypothetical protein LZ32DRAFT_601738 [Colletotrichum eremochloae]|nr:hypothetical protein LZ32DRAFT_601738 [Colletotrichum eremochloae]
MFASESLPAVRRPIRTDHNSTDAQEHGAEVGAGAVSEFFTSYLVIPRLCIRYSPFLSLTFEFHMTTSGQGLTLDAIVYSNKNTAYKSFPFSTQNHVLTEPTPHTLSSRHRCHHRRGAQHAILERPAHAPLPTLKRTRLALANVIAHVSSSP